MTSILKIQAVRHFEAPFLRGFVLALHFLQSNERHEKIGVE